MLDPRRLNIHDFTYNLPDERIPRYPAAKRDESKLLVYRDGKIEDVLFHQLPACLPPSALLVFNESKVIPARLKVKNKKGQEIEIFCLEPLSGDYQGTLTGSSPVTWRCLTGGLKKWKADESLFLEGNGTRITATLKQRESSTQLIGFSWEPASLTFSEVIEELGELPIPPYLTRATEDLDKDRYQTIYSTVKGSVAAPTAGLHFTPELIKRLRSQGVKTSSLVLHVGAGTFKPVKAELIADHEMHAEWMQVKKDFLEQLIITGDGPIIPVGTTSLRALESLYWLGVKVKDRRSLLPSDLTVEQWDPYDLPGLLNVGESLAALIEWLDVHKLDEIRVQTRILIAPPYKLKIATGLITNFHQPASTLLLLVSAVAGPQWRSIYQHALDNQYRFLSYGDSSLLIPPAR